MGSRRRDTLESRPALVRIRRLCVAKGVQGGRPLPLPRQGEGQARVSALPSAHLAADRPVARAARRSRAGAPHPGAVRARAAIVKAMILAAGFGTRLRPLTDCTPKPLLQVAGKPLISYSLALLRAAGIQEVIINLHHRGDGLRAALGKGAAYDMAITYSAENPILDTGGAIKKAQPFLEGGRFVVLNADIICDIDLQQLATWHASAERSRP